MKMVFDVESNGLHGEGFAVGWVVIDDNGEEIDSGYAGCNLVGYCQWIKENVLPHLPDPTCLNPHTVRHTFWSNWLKWKAQGATLWADCAWPVEHRFLAACVDDNSSREWEGPYPLHEIATAILIKGGDPTAKYDRLPNETPHHPTGDARQSARILTEWLKR